MRSVINPKPLMPGGTIGVISPAGFSNCKVMTDGINLLKSWGYQVKLGANALNQRGYLAGTDEERLADLLWAFTDNEVDLVLAARGGYGCTRLLPYIPWDVLAKYPKLLVGFSDLTALLNPFYQRLGWVGLHGPMLTSNLVDKDALSAESLQTMWSGVFQNPVVIEPASLMWLHGNTMTGRLMGGNLSLLAALCGTPWQVNASQHILFIEDWKESYYSIDRQFQQLAQAGVLNNLVGILLGDFSEIRQDAEWSLAEHWQQLTAYLDIPVAYGFTAGHGDRNLTLPIGGYITL